MSIKLSTECFFLYTCEITVYLWIYGFTYEVFHVSNIHVTMKSHFLKLKLFEYVTNYVLQIIIKLIWLFAKCLTQIRIITH